MVLVVADLDLAQQRESAVVELMTTLQCRGAGVISRRRNSISWSGEHRTTPSEQQL
jgi:hypothetical protein